MAKSRGKQTTGKILFTAAGFFTGGLTAAFGAATFLGNAILGASLFGTVWNVFSAKRNQSAADSVSRFDKAMNTVSSNSAIFVVYGERLVQGNQTYHQPNAERKTLRKHVVLCEGGIAGLTSVMAGGYPIKDNSNIIKDTEQRIQLSEEEFENTVWTTYPRLRFTYDYELGKMIPIDVHEVGNNMGTVFLITNNKYEDAHVIVTSRSHYSDDYSKDKWLRLYQNGELWKDIQLGGSENENLEDYNINMSSLINYINTLGEGWSAFPYAQTSREPKELLTINADCYNRYIPMFVDCLSDCSFDYHDGDTPDTYETTGSYSGCVWLDCNLTASDKISGNPNIDVIVRGRKVFDTRVNLWKYSTNPAMCLRDFLLNETFGVGWKGGLDEDSFKEAADWCDEEIEFIDQNGTTQKRRRYELNLIIDSQDDAENQVAKFLSACCGYLVRYRGIISMRIEKATPVSYYFDESHIVKDSFTISQLGLDETPNQYNINIIDPTNNWTATKCVVEDTGAQETIGYVLSKNIDLDGVTSQQQALRLGRFYRDLNTICSKVVTFSTGAQAMHLQPGDVISVSYYDAIKNVTFRITSIKEENDGQISIEAREYNPSIYNDSLGAQLSLRKYSHADENFFKKIRPPKITNVVGFTNGNSEIMAEHDPSNENNFSHYRYYIEEVT